MIMVVFSFYLPGFSSISCLWLLKSWSEMEILYSYGKFYIHCLLKGIWISIRAHKFHCSSFPWLDDTVIYMKSNWSSIIWWDQDSSLHDVMVLKYRTLNKRNGPKKLSKWAKGVYRQTWLWDRNISKMEAMERQWRILWSRLSLFPLASSFSFPLVILMLFSLYIVFLFF